MTKTLLISLGALVAIGGAAGAVLVARPDLLDRLTGRAGIVDYIERAFPVTAADGIDLRQVPSPNAALLAHVRQGVEVTVVGVVDGGNWLAVELPDRRMGYAVATAIPTASAQLGVASSAGDATQTPAVEFDPVKAVLTVGTGTKAYAGSSADAPVYYLVSAGTRIPVSAKSKDGAWVIAMTRDGHAAFLRTADLKGDK